MTVAPDLVPPRQRAPGALIATVAALVLPWSVAVNQGFAASGAWQPLHRATNGWLSPALQASVPVLALLLLAVLLSGLRLSDVGWRRGDLPRAALATAKLLVLGNLVALLSSDAPLQALGRASLSAPAAGTLVGQLFGNALLEETLFRGFLFVHLCGWLSDRGRSPRRAAWFAALASALLFALAHVPNQLYRGVELAPLELSLDLLRLVASGLFSTWVYLRTRNLFWIVAVHALVNAPTLLLPWSYGRTGAQLVMLGAALLQTLVWVRPDPSRNV